MCLQVVRQMLVCSSMNMHSYAFLRLYLSKLTMCSMQFACCSPKRQHNPMQWSQIRKCQILELEFCLLSLQSLCRPVHLTQTISFCRSAFAFSWFCQVLSRPVPCVQLSRHESDDWLMVDVDSLIVVFLYVSVVFCGDPSNSIQVQWISINSRIHRTSRLRQEGEHSDHSNFVGVLHGTERTCGCGQLRCRWVLGKAHVSQEPESQKVTFFSKLFNDHKDLQLHFDFCFTISKWLFLRLRDPPNKKMQNYPSPPVPSPQQKKMADWLKNYARCLFAKQVDAEDVLWAFRGIRRQVVWSLKASTQIGCLLLGLRMEDG